MLLERTSGALRTAGNELFALVEELSGEQPVLSGENSDIYKGTVPGTGNGFVYIRLVERGGSKNPPRSIDLHTRWGAAVGRQANYTACTVSEGSDWYGSESSANLTARAEEPAEVEDAKTFIRLAYAQFAGMGNGNG